VGEYLSENLLLTLPHRQFVWTIPKVLRVILRHDGELFADLGRLLFDILRRFFCQAAGRSLRCAMVSSHQTFGEFGVRHLHWHTIVLEGGFDRHDTFFYIPLGATAAFIEIWRRSVVALFLVKGLLNHDFACKILAWQHAGFSIESWTRILDQPTRDAFCKYLVRAPLSLRRIRWDEQLDIVTWSASPRDPSKTGPTVTFHWTSSTKQSSTCCIAFACYDTESDTESSHTELRSDMILILHYIMDTMY
jgi:hypothetical protein